MCQLCPLSLLKFLATPLPALAVGEENLVRFRPQPPSLEMLLPSLLSPQQLPHGYGPGIR